MISDGKPIKPLDSSRATVVINDREKGFFLDILQRFRQQKVPVSVPANVILSWVIKYDKDDLKEQTYFAPFPDDLLDLTDSVKKKDF